MAWRGREALPEDRGVGMPYWRTERGRDALLEGWEGLGIPTKGPGGVGRPSRRTGGLGGPPEGLGGVEMVNRQAGSLRESVPKILDGLRGPSGGPGEVGSPPVGLLGVGRTTHMSRKLVQRSGRSWEAHPEVREWSRGPLEGTGGVVRPA